MLLRIKTEKYLDRGADLTFLSAFPKEGEFLYPPLTYLESVGDMTVEMPEETEDGRTVTNTIRVITCEARMPSA